jgi:hypothetical protein
MASLQVLSAPQNQPTLNPRVVTQPTQPTLNPRVVSNPVQPTLAPRVVSQPQQPQFNPQVQPLQPQPQINVDNSPRYIPLGEAVKAKFPGIYDNLESGALGIIVATKYPGVYDQLIQPATEPTEEPKGEHGLKGFGLGAVKGALSTVSNVGHLFGKIPEVVGNAVGMVSPAAGAAVKSVGGIGKLLDPYKENFKPQGTAEKIGYGTEQAGEFLIPGGAVGKVGKAADLAVEGLNLGSKATKALQLAGKVGLGAGEAAGITALQGGDNTEVKNAAIFGGLFPIATKALGLLGSAAKETSKFISSSLSGVPKDAIEYALKNPEAVQSAIKRATIEGGDIAAQRISKNALDALDELKTARRLNYEAGLAKLEKEATYTKNGQLYITRVLTDAEAKATKGYVAGTKIGVPTNLTTRGIKQVATTTLKEFDIAAKGRTLDWAEAAIDNSHGNKLQELVDRIYAWTDTTPRGINRLRQVIDGYKIGGLELSPSSKRVNAIIGKLRTNLSEYVGTRVPQVAEMTNKYRAESEVIDAIRNQLKLGSKDPNTALRKLINVFNPKSAVYRPIVEQLGDKAGVDLMSDIAGLTMIQWTPEGLGKYLTGLTSGAGIGLSFVNPAALATLPATAAASSPRIVGKAATSLGKLGKSATGQIIKKAAPTLGLGIGTQIAR